MKLSCTIGTALWLLSSSSSSSVTAFAPATAKFGQRHHVHSSVTARWSSVTEKSAVETSMKSTTATPWTLDENFAASRDMVMSKLRESGQLPPQLDGFMYHLVSEYSQASQDSGAATPEMAARNILSAVEFSNTFGNPKSPKHFEFGTYHKAVREPFDFAKWGCNFFLPAMDLEHSAVLGEDNLRKAFEQAAAGDNVVFLANHQSEADPQVMSVLMESLGLGEEAAKVTYVAGHKVTTDPLAVAFSMGQNLLCIHSKKHINADPETKPIKSRQNLQTMSAMVGMMKEGGAVLWVAPSGGRDRRDVETGEVPIAAFDQKTVDMFRLMSNKAKNTTTHFYPLSMVTYDMCPPPDSTEAGTGEQRNVRFSPVGIACGDELENVGGVESRHLFTEKAEEDCDANYHKILEKIAELKSKSS